MEAHNCPWCGKELTRSLDQCHFCGWTRAGTQKNRTLKVYIGFFIFSFVLAIGVFAYALRYVMAPTNRLAKTDAIHFEKP